MTPTPQPGIDEIDWNAPPTDELKKAYAFYLAHRQPVADERIAAVEARANAAEPGVWFEYSEPEVGYMPTVHCPNAGKRGGHHPIWDEPKNLHFIAHARDDIPYLLAAYRAAMARVAALTEAGGFCCGWHPTDPDHPAFDDTQKYGLLMMAALLSGACVGDAHKHARAALATAPGEQT